MFYPLALRMAYTKSNEATLYVKKKMRKYRESALRGCSQEHSFKGMMTQKVTA